MSYDPTNLKMRKVSALAASAQKRPFFTCSVKKTFRKENHCIQMPQLPVCTGCLSEMWTRMESLIQGKCHVQKVTSRQTEFRVKNLNMEHCLTSAKLRVP
ncbi:hypothetical protein Pfo_000649 [Paulownia fortunei]|nr:hypothetical protein Pfo_000649 [Paulownia fortunei]